MEPSELEGVIAQIRAKAVNSTEVANFQRRLGLHGQFDESSPIFSRLIDEITNCLNSEAYSQIDPDFALVDLLEAVLSLAPQHFILNRFPLTYIGDALNAPLPQVQLLVLKIITLHCNTLLEPDLLLTIVKNYLSIEDLPVSVVNQTEVLFANLNKFKFKSVLESPVFDEVYRITAKSHSTTIARLFDFIAILSPQVDFSSHYVFPFDDLESDPLFVILLISFYKKLIDLGDSILLQKIYPALDSICGVFKNRTSNATVESFYATEISLLFAAFSFTFPDQFVEFAAKHALLKSYNLYLESSSDILLLSKINPHVLLPIEDGIIAYLLEYPLLNQKYFPVFLNLVKDEPCFRYLIQNEKLTTNALKNLSSDNTYELLFNLSLNDFSVNHLLHNLPNIVSEYLVDQKPIVNTDVYNLKVSILENLLFKEYDLLIWANDLKNTYSLMKNGQNIRHEAKVAVMDSTG